MVIWWLLAGVLVLAACAGAGGRFRRPSPPAGRPTPKPGEWYTDELLGSGENGERLLAQAREHDVWSGSSDVPSRLDRANDGC